MSKLSNLIFHGAKHYMSSPFGKRNSLKIGEEYTSTFHSGVDYATYGVKHPQYAIESGIIISCGVDKPNANAKYVWIKYPRLGVKMLHYHLDSINVKAGQAVNENTIIGYTGQTGRATGVHLHLGLKLLSGGGYIDPEEWFEKNYKEPAKSSTASPANKTDEFLPPRGYFKRGDKGENVRKINDFYYKMFPGYAKTLGRDANNVRGNLFGENTEAWTNEFKKRTGLKRDGKIDKPTLKKLVEFGFRY